LRIMSLGISQGSVALWGVRLIEGCVIGTQFTKQNIFSRSRLFEMTPSVHIGVFLMVSFGKILRHFR